MDDLTAAAAHLRDLHHRDEILLLANVWDPVTATVVESEGLPAVATTSAAVAALAGGSDDDSLPPDVVFAAVKRIAAAVSVPVTADLEAGYRLPAGELVERLLDAGAVGCNLEDTDHHGDAILVAAEAQAERLAEVRQAARAAGVDVVVNARVDVHLRAYGPPAQRTAEMIRRGRLYADAGADCVYPIGATTEEVIRAVVEAVPRPVNVLLRPGLPDLATLRSIGVARLSLGPGCSGWR